MTAQMDHWNKKKKIIKRKKKSGVERTQVFGTAKGLGVLQCINNSPRVLGYSKQAFLLLSQSNVLLGSKHVMIWTKAKKEEERENNTVSI